MESVELKETVEFASPKPTPIPVAKTCVSAKSAKEIMEDARKTIVSSPLVTVAGAAIVGTIFGALTGWAIGKRG